MRQTIKRPKTIQIEETVLQCDRCGRDIATIEDDRGGEEDPVFDATFFTDDGVEGLRYDDLCDRCRTVVHRAWSRMQPPSRGGRPRKEAAADPPGESSDVTDADPSDPPADALDI
jgi:hypothetical protein